LRPRKALSEAERNSLVKASKSPTVNKSACSERDLSIYEPIKELEGLTPVFENESKGPGRYTVIQYRDWSEEYRVRTRVETSMLRPPVNDGPRESVKLSTGVTESCYYMAKSRGGYKTSVTGTFREDVRERISSRQTTVQKEVSRTMDALQKMYQRGWTTSTGVNIEGSEKPLSYCWVVEIPLNEDGNENPHVHMMMDWRVPKSLFKEWSSRIESIWGNGYFKLEKIKDPLCAGTYMAKAANYISKSNKQDDQGTVRGNRYGISKDARAPGWFTVSEVELGIMGRLISEVNDRCKEKYENIYLERNQLRESLKKCPKDKKGVRNIIRKKLQAVRHKINQIPIVASTYQLIFRESGAFHYFMGWAIGAGWDAVKRPHSMWLEKFDQKLAHRKRNRIVKRMRWTDHEWTAAKQHYQAYENYSRKDESWIEDYNQYGVASASLVNIPDCPQPHFSSEYCQ
jgi:hypothetical protein